jgi:transposase-like protein
MTRESYFSSVILPLISTNDTSNVIEFLQRKGLLKRSLQCPSCFSPMTWIKSSAVQDGYRWKCMTRSCMKYKTTLTIRTGSPFDDVRISLKDIIHSIYIECSVERASEEVGLSKPTMIQIYAFLRRICKKYFAENPIRLGGPGVECQVDESLFVYKPKYHRGRAPEQERWVFGIVDTSFAPARGYMEHVERRDRVTLYAIIRRVCRPGTRIVSDGWAAYQGLENIEEMQYTHNVVNHSFHFVDPETGIHTQHIESYWARHKRRLKTMKGIRREFLNEYLWEFLWRERFIGNVFEEILEHIRLYYSADL